jgi:hypothetical protein
MLMPVTFSGLARVALLKPYQNAWLSKEGALEIRTRR